MSLIIQEIKITEKKSESTILSVQQTTDDKQMTISVAKQPTKSAATQHRVHEVICNALLVK